MIWHYNAFLSYEVKPVEEKRAWLDTDTANQTQVDVNNFLLQNGLAVEQGTMEQLKLAESLYASAQALWHEKEAPQEEPENALDRRA